MKSLVFLGFVGFIFQQNSFAAQTWQQALREKNINSVIVCGNDKIQTTQQSMKLNFFIGKKGFVFSNLPTSEEYWTLQKSLTTVIAKEKLTTLFKAAELFEVDETTGAVTSQGLATTVELDFKQSVKSCIETGENSRGSKSCATQPVANREQCCIEKFVSPIAIWENQKNIFKLFFEPGSGVRLSVKDENKHRFCQVHKKYLVKK